MKKLTRHYVEKINREEGVLVLERGKKKKTEMF